MYTGDKQAKKQTFVWHCPVRNKTVCQLLKFDVEGSTKKINMLLVSRHEKNVASLSLTLR